MRMPYLSSRVVPLTASLVLVRSSHHLGVGVAVSFLRPFLATSARRRRHTITSTSTTTTIRSSWCSTMSMMYKRAKLEDDTTISPSKAIIGTHSGTFQADEAMGVWMLRQLPAYRHSPVIRSRDVAVLDTQCDIVIDVGGIYDHDKLRYDHHQRGYDERFENPPNGQRCTKLSASGLVYRHYGKQVLQAYYPNLDQPSLDWAYVKLYDTLLEALDAIDTGVEMIPEGQQLLYKDTTGLSARVSRLNPRWNEVDDQGHKPDPDVRFEQASQLCGIDFLSVLTALVESDLPARQYVEQALLQRTETDASGQIIRLSSGGLPWKNHLYELEKIHAVDPLIKFVLYPDESGMVRYV